MKKKIALLLAGAMIFCNSSVAMATTVTPTSTNVPINNGSADIKAKYVGGTGRVYSVEITWGNMDFTYSDDKVWQPNSLKYTGTTAWTLANAEDNNIVVTNRSEADLNVQMSAQLTAGMSATQGEDEADDPTIKVDICDVVDSSTIVQNVTSAAKAAPTPFTSGEFGVGSAVGKSEETLEKVSKEVRLGGKLKNTLKTSTIIGSVTITITDPNPPATPDPGEGA